MTGEDIGDDDTDASSTPTPPTPPPATPPAPSAEGVGEMPRLGSDEVIEDGDAPRFEESAGETPPPCAGP